MNTFNYTTIEGETWSSISYKMYGDLSGIELLINENNIPVDPILPAGTILHIPIVEDTEIITTNLPPWK